MKPISHFRTYIIGILFLSIFCTTIQAQVGIGTITPDPSSILDMSSTTSGLLVPRMTLAQRNLIGTPATGLMIYQTDSTPGHYVFDGSIWNALAAGSASIDWTLSGNAGTVPGVGVGQNYFGTSDAQALVFGTSGTERIRIFAGGRVSVNNPTPVAGDRFTVTGASDNSSINGYSSGTNGIGVYGENTTNGFGVWGNVGSGLGVFGTSTGGGVGIQGQNSSTGWGTVGINTGTGPGVQGQTNSTGIGVFGFANNAAAEAIVGLNLNASGVGIAGSANTLGYVTLPSTGGVFYGTNGSASFSSSTTGTGSFGVGNNGTTIYPLANGAGVSGNANTTGVYGIATATTGARQGAYFTMNKAGAVTPAAADDPIAILAGFDGTDYFGGYFDGNQDNAPGGGGGNAGEDYAYVGYRSAGTTYKILGTGSNSTMVNDSNGNKRVLFSPEAPEILFEDYGVGQLVNGSAQITLDPLLSSVIHVSSNHPLKVFIQLEGDCNGVFVTNKTAQGFTVTEQKRGTSNVPFSWHIVANRADTVLSDGTVFSRHADVRFPIGPNKISPKVINEVKSVIAPSGKSMEAKVKDMKKSK